MMMNNDKNDTDVKIHLRERLLPKPGAMQAEGKNTHRNERQSEMTAEDMMEILKNEYGINSREELDNAIGSFKGIDIGLFVERSEDDEG